MGRLAVEMHGAGAALAEPTAEMRVVEAEVVAQHVEQRRVGIGLDRAVGAVDVEGELFVHETWSSLVGAYSHPIASPCGVVQRRRARGDYSETGPEGMRLRDSSAMLQSQKHDVRTRPWSGCSPFSPRWRCHSLPAVPPRSRQSRG